MSSLTFAYLNALIEHPVRTKSLTSGTLNGLAELIGGIISGQKDEESESYFSSRVLKMALYGALVSGPLSHYLIDLVQKAFRRSKKGWASNISQIVAINLLVNPILAVTYITWMAVIAGARSIKDIRARIRASLWSVLRSQWVTSPLLIAFAQKYIPKLAWTPVFSFFAFILTTYHNTIVRKRIISRDQSKSE